ncbi:hypothetical protein Rhow_001111 [Rhodococcus wratislaviensis]|uniref:HNH endonuclease n=1 Tax=Rhodococcus wratislaviensis TaxID=44752 RepID=A0A402CN82_RHOWR|nr:HNH endonuclease signature motif containing protein [Rhodococcus wratislaviensis]GCE45084.1 hypothetical protein Rhow_001111 [Rhodococcus wratislaviensis]
MSDEVRYSKSASKNKVLRLALLNAWDSTCYWCGEPRDFNEVAIDHVIPHTIKRSDLDLLLADLLRGDPALEDEYDLHAAANLAPICTPCNGEKSAVISTSGRFEMKFKKARAKATDVEKWVRSFGSSNRVAKAVMAVTTADLENPRSKQSLTDFAPVLAARLRVLDYTTTDEHDDPNADETEQVVVTLDNAGRRTRDLIEDLYGLDLNEALLAPIRATKSAITSALVSAIGAYFEDRGHVEPDIGCPIGRMRIEADGLRYDRLDEQFELTGSFDADIAAEVWVTSADGSEIDTPQGDANGRGHFTVRFWDDGHRRIESDDYVELKWTGNIEAY